MRTETNHRSSTRPRKDTGAAATPSPAEIRPARALVTDALTAHPGATAIELAAVTGLGRSTVSKALALLESTGAAHRDPSPRDTGRRPPDRWSPPPTEPPTESSSATKRHRPSRTPPAATNAAAEVGRLRRGELGTLVLEHLLAHPTQDLGPAAVATALNRSPGAVANALAKFAASGDLMLTSEAPRRYRIVTT